MTRATGAQIRDKRVRKFQQSCMEMVDSWKSGTVPDDLEALASDTNVQWLPDFVSAAREFYQSGQVQDAIRKNKKFGPEFYREIFGDYFLVMNGLYGENRGRTDMKKSDPQLYLTIDEQKAPLVLKLDRSNVPCDYFGERLLQRIMDCIYVTDDGVKIIHPHAGEVSPKKRAAIEALSSEHFLAFARALHFSIPLYKGDVSLFCVQPGIKYFEFYHHTRR